MAKSSKRAAWIFGAPSSSSVFPEAGLKQRLMEVNVRDAVYLLREATVTCYPGIPSGRLDQSGNCFRLQVNKHPEAGPG
ncbi:MAG: hypothetical protein JWL90_622 [Chthoniobacteraceae bacterium]|nr:hypothetical protein [Chthoniobacteraceae bacterium]